MDKNGDNDGDDNENRESGGKIQGEIKTQLAINIL